MWSIKQFFNPEFYVEYLPYTGKYVARYGNSYLHSYYGTGAVLREYNILFATTCITQNEACNLINTYKEQRNSKLRKIIECDN